MLTLQFIHWIIYETIASRAYQFILIHILELNKPINSLARYNYNSQYSINYRSEYKI